MLKPGVTDRLVEMAEDASHGGASRRREVRTRATRGGPSARACAAETWRKSPAEDRSHTRLPFFALAQFVSKYGGQRKNLNLDNAQQALEEDSSAVEMLRRDVLTFQEMELDTRASTWRACASRTTSCAR